MAVGPFRLPCVRCFRVRFLDTETELCVTVPPEGKPMPPLALRVTCHEWDAWHRAREAAREDKAA